MLYGTWGASSMHPPVIRLIKSDLAAESSSFSATRLKTIPLWRELFMVQEKEKPFYQ